MLNQKKSYVHKDISLLYRYLNMSPIEMASDLIDEGWEGSWVSYLSENRPKLSMSRLLKSGDGGEIKEALAAEEYGYVISGIPENLENLLNDYWYSYLQPQHLPESCIFYKA